MHVRQVTCRGLFAKATISIKVLEIINETLSTASGIVGGSGDKGGSGGSNDNAVSEGRNS